MKLIFFPLSTNIRFLGNCESVPNMEDVSITVWGVNSDFLKIDIDEMFKHAPFDAIDKNWIHRWALEEPIWHDAIYVVARGGS